MAFKSCWDDWSPSTDKTDRTPLLVVDSRDTCPQSTDKTDRTDRTPSRGINGAPNVNRIWWALRNMKEEELRPNLKGDEVLLKGVSVSPSVLLLDAIAASKRVLLHWLRHPFSKLRDFEIEFFARAFAHHRLAGSFQIYCGPDLYACFEGFTAIVPDGVAKSELQNLFPYGGEPLILQSEIVNSTSKPDPTNIEELSSAIVLPTTAVESWFEAQLAKDSDYEK
jgi:hypothetical protein